MKKLLSVFLMLFALSCSVNENNKKVFSLSVDLQGMEAKQVILSKVLYQKLKNLDTATIIDGHFSFKDIPFPHPELYCLLFDDRKMIVEFFSDCDDMRMTIHTGDDQWLEVKKSKSHAEFVSFLDDNRIFESKRESLLKQNQIAAINHDTARICELDSMMQDVDKEQARYIKGYVKANPSSFVGAYMTLHTMPDICKKEELRTLQEFFSDTVRISSYYQEISLFLSEK